MLEVLLVGYHTPKPKGRRGAGTGLTYEAGAVFVPSLAKQRHALVLQLVQERRPTRFLDAGRVGDQCLPVGSLCWRLHTRCAPERVCLTDSAHAQTYFPLGNSFNNM
jgi:hypothetical protein